jgi:hypothetical protein
MKILSINNPIESMTILSLNKQLKSNGDKVFSLIDGIVDPKVRMISRCDPKDKLDLALLVHALDPDLIVIHTIKDSFYNMLVTVLNVYEITSIISPDTKIKNIIDEGLGNIEQIINKISLEYEKN